MATSSKNTQHDLIIPSSSKRKPGRPKSVFTITGEIVPYDTFGPNKNNPYEKLADQQRQEALESMLGDIILQQVGRMTVEATKVDGAAA